MRQVETYVDIKHLLPRNRSKCVRRVGALQNIFVYWGKTPINNSQTITNKNPNRHVDGKGQFAPPKSRMRYEVIGNSFICTSARTLSPWQLSAPQQKRLTSAVNIYLAGGPLSAGLPALLQPINDYPAVRSPPFITISADHVPSVARTALLTRPRTEDRVSSSHIRSSPAVNLSATELPGETGRASLPGAHSGSPNHLRQPANAPPPRSLDASKFECFGNWHERKHRELNRVGGVSSRAWLNSKRKVLITSTSSMVANTTIANEAKTVW